MKEGEMISKQLKWSVAIVILILIAGIHAHAQVSAGAVLGTVSDSSGALIPGVAITVTNEGTNQSRQAITSETGTYRVEPLQAGSYTVTAELSGFRKEIRSKINVDVNARVRMDF